MGDLSKLRYQISARTRWISKELNTGIEGSELHGKVIIEFVTMAWAERVGGWC